MLFTLNEKRILLIYILIQLLYGFLLLFFSTIMFKNVFLFNSVHCLEVLIHEEILSLFDLIIND